MTMSRTTYQSLLDGKVYIGGIDAVDTADAEHQIDAFFDLRGIRDGDVHEKSVYTPLTDGEEATSLQRAVQQMKEAVEAGETIYMHCNTGRGRTGAAATALLLELGVASSIEEAEQMVKEARDVIDIRPNFREALQQLYK